MLRGTLKHVAIIHVIHTDSTLTKHNCGKSKTTAQCNAPSCHSICVYE